MLTSVIEQMAAKVCTSVIVIQPMCAYITVSYIHICIWYQEVGIWLIMTKGVLISGSLKVPMYR